MYKLILSIVLLSVSAITSESAFAAGGTTRGFFVGINAGSSKINLNKTTSVDTGERADFDPTKATKNPAFAFGIDTGYMFNQYVGVQFSINKYQQIISLEDNEPGVYSYTRSHSEIETDDNPTVTEDEENTKSVKKDDIYKSNAYVPSLSLLLARPINEKWAIYGQVGIALTSVHYETREEEFTKNNNGINHGPVKSSTHRETKLVPQFGVGVKYSLNNHLALSVGYNRTSIPIINQFDTKDQNALNYYHVGLTYTF